MRYCFVWGEVTASNGHRNGQYGNARLITIDMDPTDDPTTQLSFSIRHYDNYAYLRHADFPTFNQEAEQYSVTAVLYRREQRVHS